jgi:hypothetical protein
MLGGVVQFGGNGSVGAFGGAREVAGPLLDVRDRGGQRTVCLAALPERRLPVADRGEQRVRESDTVVLERDHSFARGELERLPDNSLVSAGRANEIDGGTARCGGDEQDLPRPLGKTRDAPPKQRFQVAGDRQRLPRLGSRPTPLELSAELEGKERIPT